MIYPHASAQDEKLLLLELQDVSKTFGANKILCDVNLTLAKGEVICLSGPSGTGKSTLLEIAAGILHADSGQVRSACRPALAFQDDALLPRVSCLQNLLYVLPAQWPLIKRKAIALSWLKAFELTPEKFPQQLSGGMRRRLNLARAFASGRQLLLLDEPFAFLDEARQKVLAAYCIQQAEQGHGLFITSHNFTALLDTARALSFPRQQIRLYRLEGGMLQPLATQ